MTSPVKKKLLLGLALVGFIFGAFKNSRRFVLNFQSTISEPHRAMSLRGNRFIVSDHYDG